jgi:stage V sporulation protein G
MEITEVRIKLMEDSDDRLQAFCSITFDNSFVVRDLKIIDGSNGPFVAMPSRKLTSHCHQCGSKNHLKAQYCNQCGTRQRDDRTVRDAEGRAKLYADIAHPINSSCREMIQNRVISEYRGELDRAQQPGYVSKYDDDYDDDIDAASLLPQEPGRPAAIPPLPPGTQVQPAQSQPPAPHILPAPQPASGAASSSGSASSSSAGPANSGPSSTGGPHFGQAPSQREPARETARESAKQEAAPREPARQPDPPAAPQKPKPKGDFGAGVF